MNLLGRVGILYLGVIFPFLSSLQLIDHPLHFFFHSKGRRREKNVYREFNFHGSWMSYLQPASSMRGRIDDKWSITKVGNERYK
ncbi:hypothetical protein GGS20DRAFT_542650 [Poronia punctata]|nr:hypothetical protein GGS20DRAFT_542650 [Poronia punctata]